MENRYVYWDNITHCFREIPEKNIDKPVAYFDDIDDYLGDDDEIAFFKLIPYKTLKRKVEVNYEFE